jgi:quinol monooxygenase YgiN
MIVLVARYYAQPSKGDAVIEVLQKMASLVKEHEPDCRLYQVCRSKDDADFLLLYEQYTDDAAVQKHRETPYFQELIIGNIVPLLEKREPAFFDLVVT